MSRNWHRDRFIPSDDCIHQACVACGKSMWFPPSKAGKYLTCGRECNSARRAELKRQRKRNCETCGNEFYPRKTQIDGPENPRWTGGRRATYIRQREAGVYRKASHDRWVRVGKKLEPGTVERIGDRQRRRCAACGKCVKDKFDLDHIYPLSKGGQHEESNLQILCASCNRSKGAKDPIEYMQSKGKLL